MGWAYSKEVLLDKFGFGVRVEGCIPTLGDIAHRGSHRYRLAALHASAVGGPSLVRQTINPRNPPLRLQDPPNTGDVHAVRYMVPG